MLVAIPLDGEEGVYKRLRESEFYKGKFGNEYYRRMSEMNSIVEVAKMYIVDNYKKVSDWAELHFELRGYAEDKGTLCFGMKDAERKRRYPPKAESETKPGKRKVRSERFHHLEEMMKKHDEERIQISTFDEAVYDWTDGDFSITINGKEYWWINHRNPDTVIEIAHFIEKTLNETEQSTKV
jgi:hypothetical protein